MSIGEMEIIIIPHIERFSDKNKKFKEKNKRPLIKTFLHYFILLFIYNLTIVVPNIVMERFNSQNQNKISIVDLHKEGLCIF